MKCGFGSFLQGDTYTQEKQFPVVVACQGTVNGRSGQWSRELNSLEGRTTRQNTAWIETIANGLDTQVRAGEAALYPSSPTTEQGDCGSRSARSRLTRCRRVHGSLGIEIASIRHRTRNGCSRGSRPRKSRPFRKAKPSQSWRLCAKRYGSALRMPRTSILTWPRDELLLRFADREVPFDYLSDGYRNMLAMVADIAVRCATLNPALKEEAIRTTPGVVLIDEIDLHLHPKWQRRVVTDLLAAFPKIQFVATTHSPFIIQSLVPREHIELLNMDNAEASDYADKSVEDIAEQLQGAGEQTRSERYKAMMEAAEEYYRALQQVDTVPPDQLQELKDRLEELASRFSDDPAYQAILKVEREARLGHHEVANATD